MGKPNLSRRADTALQMTLHPRDADTARALLSRQLDAWAPIVERVVLTVDSRPAIDCRGPSFRDARKALFLLLEEMRRDHRHLGVDTVVYADHFRRRIAARFFGGALDWPDHAVDGSPFYGQFFGLMRVNARRTLHLAPRALHSGDHGDWFAAAMAALDADGHLLGLSPHGDDLPGPGRSEASVLLDMDRLCDAVAPLDVVAPPLTERIAARFLAREDRSRAAMVSIAQGAALADMGLGVSDRSANWLDPLRSGRHGGALSPGRLGARAYGAVDRVFGAQLKRLGRI